jgi:hypothetical protein
MALRTGRPSERALCLDVWLGPMDGVRYCGAPGATGVVRIGRRRQDEKRGIKNDLVLPQGDGISGFHAEVRVAQGRVLLRDLNSTNGTFADSHRVSGEIPLEVGENFVLSTTIIHTSIIEEPPTPPAVVLADEEIAASVPFGGLLAAAGRVATRRGEGWVDTRHLADALIESGETTVGSALRSAGLSDDQAVQALWSGAFFDGPLQWLRRFLMLPEGAPTQEAGPAISEAVRGIFGAASIRLTGYSEQEAKALAAPALFVALANSTGPIAAWMKERKIRAEPVAPSRRAGARKTNRGAAPSPSIATRTIEEPARKAALAASTAAPPFVQGDTHVLASRASMPSPAPRPGRETPVTRSGEFRAMRPPPVSTVPTTGDAVLDQRARTIALEIEEAAALYRFSTPEDRRSVMKTLVKRALSSIAPENRSRILSQIRVQFPILDAPPPAVSDEAPKLRARIRELEQRVHELSGTREGEGKAKKGQAGTGTGVWKMVLAPAAAGPVSAEADALRATLTFARNLEKFLLGLIQVTTTPGDATRSFRLQSYRYTLETVLQSIQEGKPTGLAGLSDYLRELERWQVAILAAHHEGPRIWFEKLWKKINPAVIEAGAGKAGGSWKIGGQSGDWWNRYKEVVRGLNPDIVQDQVLQTAAKTAQEEFEKLSKVKN